MSSTNPTSPTDTSSPKDTEPPTDSLTTADPGSPAVTVSPTDAISPTDAVSPGDTSFPTESTGNPSSTEHPNQSRPRYLKRLKSALKSVKQWTKSAVEQQQPRSQRHSTSGLSGETLVGTEGLEASLEALHIWSA
ncbi:MAG: hypothetical protein HETSPECPRED_002409 [Heterodermia speciosa]|uniref:Uncharacterized protein n=1 Tax=Heterodermia speciosa TaxID=116794 RepID=A0A8H3PFW9_9LECA|nr:MAG: hypothetical protein HETSPECPRED_002409 [Heterodermia speciosa]